MSFSCHEWVSLRWVTTKGATEENVLHQHCREHCSFVLSNNVSSALFILFIFVDNKKHSTCVLDDAIHPLNTRSPTFLGSPFNGVATCIMLLLHFNGNKCLPLSLFNCWLTTKLFSSVCMLFNLPLENRCFMETCQSSTMLHLKYVNKCLRIEEVVTLLLVFIHPSIHHVLTVA